MAAYGVRPWDGGYEMTVGLWQNADRAIVRKGASVAEAIAAAFGSPTESWFRALTGSEEEAKLMIALHKASPKPAIREV